LLDICAQIIENLYFLFKQPLKMPQVTELEKGAPTVQDGSDNTDSDSDDSVPELEDAATGVQSQVRKSKLVTMFMKC
jgi:hypothetical protein